MSYHCLKPFIHVVQPSMASGCPPKKWIGTGGAPAAPWQDLEVPPANGTRIPARLCALVNKTDHRMACGPCWMDDDDAYTSVVSFRVRDCFWRMLIVSVECLCFRCRGARHVAAAGVYAQKFGRAVTQTSPDISHLVQECCLHPNAQLTACRSTGLHGTLGTLPTRLQY